MARFGRNRFEDEKQLVMDIATCQPKMFAHLIIELARAQLIPLLNILRGYRDRLIRRIQAEKTLLQDFVSLLSRVFLEMPAAIKHLSLRDPTITELIPP